MGLDSVEILMEVEDEFGIRIDNFEAGRALTVGMLYEIVLRELNETYGDSVCPTLKSFNCLRKVMVEKLGIQRKAIRPSTMLKDIFPKKSRRQDWKVFQEMVQCNIPCLKGPKFVSRLGLILLVINIVLLCVLCPHVSGMLWRFIVCLTVTMLFWFMFGIFTAPICINIPKGYGTVGDVLNKIVPANADYIKDQNSQIVWEKLISIICDNLSLDEHEVYYEAEFVKDLGLS